MRGCKHCLAYACSRRGLDPSTNRFHHPMVYHENYSFGDWPPNHTFPMDKFRLTAEALAREQKPRPLVRDPGRDFFRPLDFADVPREWLSGPIDASFLDRFLAGTLSTEERRRIGFREQTPRRELIERTVLEVAGTVLACQLAARWGLASNVAGGTHHATPTMGAGYTILNDLAVAANFLTDRDVHGGTVARDFRRVLVVDLDVHQGDGTAKFMDVINGDGRGEDRLSTLSLHCGSNYPHPKATSTYDVPLPEKMGDEDYLEVLRQSLDVALEEVRPDFVLYDAGVDVYRHDTLGRLRLSLEGIRRRDRHVLERCVGEEKIPVACVIGGGYEKDGRALALRHSIIHEECAYMWRKHRLWEREGE